LNRRNTKESKRLDKDIPDSSLRKRETRKSLEECGKENAKRNVVKRKRGNVQ